MKAYHFVGGETLRNGDPVPADGVWLEHVGPLVLCESGYHASVCPFDALQFAPGPMLCRVEVDGEILDGGDKLCARRRRILARIDATAMLSAFARACASDVLHLWDAPEIVRRWLATGDETIRATARASAWDSARDSARDSAWASARDSAWASAWASARDSAWASAWDSARDSAWASAWDSAWDSAWASSAWDSAWDSAWASSAWDSAWASAWAQQRLRFRAAVLAAFTVD